MTISKYAVACVAAIFAGGVTAGLADGGTVPVPAQVTDEDQVTPVSAVAYPDQSFDGVAVRFVSGKSFGRVVAVSTDARGHAARLRIALDSGERLWIDRRDLVYSRARDSIIAQDVHPPMTAIASR
jgi:hypothetical protein